MAGVTEELRVLVEAEVERAIAQFQKLDETVNKNEKQTKKLGDALDSLSGKSMVISAAFAGAGIASIKFAGELEKTQKSLEVLLRDAEKATQVKNEWTALAAETPFQTEDIDRAGKMLLAFGVGADKVTESLRQIGDISAATGSSISELADLYGKAKVQGRLFAQDINQFQGRGIPIVQELAKQMGVAESRIRQLVEAGKIGFPEIEKAFASMTEPGGQFAGMMDELSKTTLGKFSTATDNAKLAMAGFGEILLPTANDVLDAATNIFSAMQEMDDGTKRFIVTFGGVVTASGPVIFAVHGINVALTALAANPAFLVIAGSVVAIGLAAGAVNKYNNQLADSVKKMTQTSTSAQSLIDSYAGLDKTKKLDVDTTEKLISLYPKLRGELVAYKTTVEDAEAAIEKYTDKQIKQAIQGQITHLSRLSADIDRDSKALIDAGRAYTEAHDLFKAEWVAGAVDAETFKYELSRIANDTNVNNLNKNVSDMKDTYKRAFEDLNLQIAATGKRLNENLQLEDIPISVTPELTPNTEVTAEAKKTWQEWWDEVTGVSKDSFDTGGKAGQLYIDGLVDELNRSQAISDVLGDKFDLSGVLESQQGAIKKTITTLLSIPADEIDEQYSLVDTSVKKLVERYKELDDQAKSASVITTLDDLRTKVDELGKSEAELTLEKLKSNGATEAQITEAQKLLELLNTADITGWQDKLSQSLTDSLDNLDLFASQSNKIIGDLGGQLASISFDAALSGFSEFGKALGSGSNAAESLQQALAAMAEQILNQLPTMFLQAGLQLIAQGQWPLGLGFIAAAGSTALISGFVQGRQSSDAEANALGGVYGNSGYSAFAKGGTFTNSIVTQPTFFKYAKGSGFGTGVMGEAGSEAIVPLKRGVDGSLGVSAVGLGGGEMQLSVVINNYGNEQVSAKETTTENGQRQLEITVGTMINQHLSSGKADKALAGRYHIKAQGV